jgi:glycosyltransferase involved in cell wall biosynthesis
MEALRDGLTGRGWRVETVALGRVPDPRPLRRRVDVVHAHGIRAGWAAALTPGTAPVVVTVHNVGFDAFEEAAALRRRLERRLGRHVDALIAASAGVAARTGGRVITPVWPRPQVLRPGAAVRAAFGMSAETPLVVTVARLHPQKGLDTLIDAAAIVTRQVHGARFVIVGGGPLEAQLRARIAAHGLVSAVELTGPSENAPDELAAADVVAVSSVWESGPFVVLEALELGRAVVATPVGCVPAVVEEGATGRIVPIGDSGALADAITGLLRDSDARDRLGRAGRARIAEWADRDDLLSQVEAVYEEVLASP